MTRRHHTTVPLALGLLAAMFAAGSPATAYVVNGKWKTTNVPYYVNPSNLDVSTSAAVAAVQYSADAWSSQSETSFRFVYGGTISATSFDYDQKVYVIFRSSGSDGNALATTYYWSIGGEMTDADIIMWDSQVTFFTGSSGCSGGWYIEDVGTHEFGHALGLGHTGVSGATMTSGQAGCSTYKRTLEGDDIAGVESLYPPANTNLMPPRAPTGVKMISRVLGPGGPTGLSLSGVGGRLPGEAAPAELTVRREGPVPVQARRRA